VGKDKAQEGLSAQIADTSQNFAKRFLAAHQRQQEKAKP
jgi:hypothetical protein